jgi:hypothetical protein
MVGMAKGTAKVLARSKKRKVALPHSELNRAALA